jgi:nucleoside-diphosphate-sugar epimerase
MRLLFIGGTGLISSACSALAVDRGHELFILARGVSTKYPVPDGAILVQADVELSSAEVPRPLKGRRFDAVVDFLAYTPDDAERHLAMVRDQTDQFVLISSASAYQKPPRTYLVTEDTPLENPYWQYSRDKIACEERLLRTYHEEGVPITIVRPSLTYGPSQIPLCVGSWAHPWTLVDRMQRDREIIVPGDGSSLWVLTWNADFAKGLLGVLGNPLAIGEAFHITSDEVLTWDEIYVEVFRALDLPPKILHVSSELIAAFWPNAQGSLLGDKMHSLVFNNNKIKRLVPDFTCTVKWAEGLRHALAWHESRAEFKTLDRDLDETMDKIVAAHHRLLDEA